MRKTIELPEPTKDYLNEIKSSWNDHFEKRKKERKSYCKVSLATYLKKITNDLVSNNEKLKKP